MNQLGLQNTEQLFEYFLVDPGMEPVVQTSRIRLALSSVQTFIQRCLLNLEQKVDPSAIPSKQWEWMKRYRVWQANREIFLWPENWMEPEWRLDKTDLFQVLESALLQGDVTNELVEDAFFTYLKDLDVRARLDIVTMYLEEVPNDPASNTLHVIGRNHGKPQKYFYRRFAFGTWTAWEPVKADIDGDHLAVVVWRERLHLFWVTFSQKSQAPDLSSQNSGDTLVNMTFGDLAQNLSTLTPQNQVQLQLNWSEYFQGKWSDRKSSDLRRSPSINVLSNFDPVQVFIHVAKETDDNGNEGAVKVILDNPIFGAFRLVGKNSEPTFGQFDSSGKYYEYPEVNPYSFVDENIDATKTAGSGPFQVYFLKEIVTQNGQLTDISYDTDSILQQGNDFALLVCDAPVMPISGRYQSPNSFFTAEPKVLSRPFFYQDSDNGITLFGQPTVAETIQSYVWGPIQLSLPDPMLANDSWWNTISLVSQVPHIGTVNPGDPSSIYNIQARADWVTNPATAISFGTTLIGQSGALSIQKGSIGSFTTEFPMVLGNIRGADVQTSLSGTKLNIVSSAGLNLAGLQTSKAALSAIFNEGAVDPTLNRGGIS